MNSVSKPTVGFIGLGIMGGPMASNLQKAGYQLVVNDVKKEAAKPHLDAGATWADTPRALAGQCEVMFTCLPNLKAIESVALGADGLVNGIRKGHACFEMSTNSTELLKRLHAAFQERGAHLLDAPISGGGPGARRGRLGCYVGGDKATYERYVSVIRGMCDSPIHVGDVGSGLVTKLVHNCASQSIQAVIAEVFSMGVKAGADPLSLWEAIRLGAVGRRRSFDGLVDQFLPGNFDQPQAALRIIEKDMMLATELGRTVGAPMRMANMALADIVEAMNRGWAERDARSVMLLPQERVGISIKVDPKAIQEVFQRDPPAPTDTRYGNATK
jgi:3-hydroxyisobutyrate dehydrogenase-like beta-hydroxyacid dehydrogenase